jgi:inorganic pyrophosphatase
MSVPLDELPAIDPDSGRVNVVVDTPKGSRNKYKLDEQTGQWRLSKILPAGLSFPYDFGFIPSTEEEDGDPIDVLLLGYAATFAGCIVPARLIGVIEAEQTENGKTIRNDRLIAAIETPFNPLAYRSLADVGEQELMEIEQFFVSYNRTQRREFKPLGRKDAERAEALLEQALKTERSRSGRSRKPRARSKK